jgi:hypothetical protein
MPKAGFEADSPLEQKLREDKNLTGEFYRRISGAVAWKQGEREIFAEKFEALAGEIALLQRRDAAEWFASLPPE